LQKWLQFGEEKKEKEEGL